MNELIVIKQVTIGNDEVNSVDARELHEFLESKQQFADWIKAKVLNSLFFEENVDYIGFRNVTNNSKGGRPSKDYALTIETAKKVAMAEQTARGNEVREYFIELQTKAEKILESIEYIDFKGNIHDLVFYNNGRALTTSRIIAEKFEEEHKNVLQIIDALINNNIDNDKINDFNQLNFKPVEYLDAKGELRKAYELTEEGFSLVALSFTGNKALEFKVDFINAFFQMRTALMNRIKAEVIRTVLPESNGKRNYVYIIGNNDNDYIKIGVAQDVEQRLKQLQTGTWSELYVIYRSMVCSNSFNIETSIHNKIKDYQVKGEWYNISHLKIIDLLEQENYVLKTSFLKDYYENTKSNIKISSSYAAFQPYV